jgi:tight adherence protein C
VSFPAIVAIGCVVVLLAIALSTPRPIRQIGDDPRGLKSGVDRTARRRAPRHVVERIGHLARRLAVAFLVHVAPRRAESVLTAAVPTDRTIGIGVLVSALVAVIDVRLPIVAGATVLLARRFGPVLTLRKTAAKKSEAVEQATPILVDLVRAGVASGVAPRTLFLTLQTTATIDELTTFNAALASLQQSLQSGIGFVEALEAFKQEGAPILGLVAALQASELYGVAIGPSLDALSIDARLARRRRIETKARRLPISLLFPLVVCVLPAFMLLTVVPLLFSGLSSIHW